jgi:hypothetical protein
MPINQGITLRLDVAFALEALILNRLRRLPKSRCEEWLRGLLVQGFQCECRMLKELQGAGQAGHDAPRTQDIATHSCVLAAGHQSTTPQAKANRGKSAAIQVPHSGAVVSFAALRKVIG